MSAPNARALFAAAREDGPDATERDEVFRKIALSTGIATGAAAVATVLTLVPSIAADGAAAAVDAASNVSNAATAGGASAKVAATGASFGMKLLALGAVLGAASTALGVVLALTVVTPESSRTSSRAPVTLAPATVAGGARLAEPATRRRDVNDRESTSAIASASSSANVIAPPAAQTDPSSDLAEEARLVTAARSSLMAGDPARALTLVQATRKLSARSLEPEELGLEARALQALGRVDDAAATELVLRRRYPDHALSR